MRKAAGDSQTHIDSVNAQIDAILKCGEHYREPCVRAIEYVHYYKLGVLGNSVVFGIGVVARRDSRDMGAVIVLIQSM